MQPFFAWSIDMMAARSRGRLPASHGAAQQAKPVSPHVEGTTMDIGLSRSEPTGLADSGGRFSGRSEKSAIKAFRSGFVWLPIGLIACVGVWVLLSSFAGNSAENEPGGPATAAMAEPPASSAIDATPMESSFDPATTQTTAAEPVPVDGLKISSQSWRRGGLGSKALVTLTLRNGNDYAVKDIEITCAFSRRDGSHLTDRTRVIHDTVNMKSRRIFARMHVGFVNVNANGAKCSLVAASRF
jgi:hypothetical protein